jgi:asparagine synthase (glutamine-hydrolysing)
MSGIVGLFRRDGFAVVEPPLQAMVATLAHRGPDGSAVICSGPAGLGHTMLWTTPESLYEVLPWRHQESGLIITADARIDNRDELIAELGGQRRNPAITDSELILEAYRKWGQECPQRLLGDFAFAIWDPSQQQFFCARDPMGVRCLYYFASDSLFAFGTEIKALFRLPEIPKRLNELRVLDYLENNFDDRAITFYKDIYRLPSASTLLIDRRRSRIAKYWSFDPKRELKLKSDDEYTEAFRDCFVRSIRDRLRSAFPVGSALSGGLDSSSIACVARRIRETEHSRTPLHTFSLIFPSLPEQDLPAIDERKYMQDVLALGGFQPHFIHADKLSPMRDVRRVHQHSDEACCALNLYLHWGMFENVNRGGVRIFLDGFDGDTAVSYGFEHLRDLALGLKWRTLRQEARLLANNLRMPARTLILDHCVMPLCPGWPSKLYGKIRRRRDLQTLDTFGARQFKQRLGFKRRVQALRNKPKHRGVSSARENHLAGIEHPGYTYSLEIADKASAAFHVEARYPFFDRRLLELCLALPTGQKLRQGWNRWILRRAMTGYLPESVQWRVWKGDLSANFSRKMLEYDRLLIEDTILHNTSELEPYVDLLSIRKAYETYKATPLGHRGSFNLFAAVNLALWLRSSAVKLE